TLSFNHYTHHPHLPSFPTRRSSDLREKGEVKILAVTALTSLDRGDLDDLGFSCDLERLVLSRARRALQAGCDGVVSSGLEAQKRSEEHTSELQSLRHLVCRLLLEKK